MYSYRKVNVETGEMIALTKAKGIQQTSDACESVHFDSMKGILKTELMSNVGLDCSDQQDHITVNFKEFRRSKYRRIVTTDAHKTIRFTFNKGIIGGDTRIYPYGYKGAMGVRPDGVDM